MTVLGSSSVEDDCVYESVYYINHHYHQPINVPTARAQAFLMDCT
jgi:hypothetical protein